MALSPTEELRLPGLRLRHPPDADVRTQELETRRYRIRRVEIRSPWLISEGDPSQAGRYRIRVMIFEDPDGVPVGDLLEEGHVQPEPGRHELVKGVMGGREAVIREPVDPHRSSRAAYVEGDLRFFFVEWEGPSDAILDTLELEPRE